MQVSFKSQNIEFRFWVGNWEGDVEWWWRSVTVGGGKKIVGRRVAKIR